MVTVEGYGDEARAGQPTTRVAIFGTGRYVGLFLEKNSAGHEADHSSPSRLQIKNGWISASTPHVFLKCKGRIYVLFVSVL
jgi:hypothetical protein